MGPDFSKATIENLAKRAHFFCSNPDCRVSTVGPSSDPQKATTIGEAAHIKGARPGSARYDEIMSEVSRSEITNAIWLCRNCHKIIDRDPDKYPADLLFAWRETHESYIGENLGNRSDRLKSQLDNSQLDEFREYPPIIRRIVLDRPIGWEWRLTAELMRHLNKPLLKRHCDLHSNMYSRQIEYISDDQMFVWFENRLEELRQFIQPLDKIATRLTASWGAPGEPGNIEEIHHTCLLIRDVFDQALNIEERLRFVRTTELFENLPLLLRNLASLQVQKISVLPDELDQVCELIGTDHGGTIENPLIIEKVIEFDVPEGWVKRLEAEFQDIQNKTRTGQSGNFRLNVILGVVVVSLLFLLF